jgi:hypothetical protein
VGVNNRRPGVPADLQLFRPHGSVTGLNDLEEICNQPEPTAWSKRSSRLDYRLPEYTVRLLRHVLGVLGGPNVIVDIGSSYGFNSALLNHHLTLADLYSHYRRDHRADPAGWINADRQFFSDSRRPQTVPVIGVGLSVPALDYGISVGLLTNGITSDLEHDVLEPAEASLLSRSTVVCVSAGAGHIGQRTFLTLVGAATRRPVIAGFFLRWVDVRPIAQTLAIAGYEFTADYGSVYPERRFASRADRRTVLEGLQQLGFPLTSTELSGYQGAIPFIAVPSSLPQRRVLTSALSALIAPV